MIVRSILQDNFDFEKFDFYNDGKDTIDWLRFSMHNDKLADNLQDKLNQWQKSHYGRVDNKVEA